MNHHCRVRRVKLKTGGSTVHLLPQVAEGEMNFEMLRASRKVNQMFPDNLVGYVVMGWTADGHYSLGYHNDDTKCVVGRTLLPSWVADAIRRSLIENGSWS